MRQSTTEHTRLTYLRLQERQVAPRRRKGTRHERPLTQAELLAEAKVTAEINLRSLGKKKQLLRVTPSKTLQNNVTVFLCISNYIIG